MKVLALILAGGRGSRLDILSENRVKPSVPFAGKFRIIDFTLSNCSNSGIYNIAILTQYLPFSLNEHIGSGRPWDLDRRDSKVTLLQPHSDWYNGTADAVRKNIHYIEQSEPELVLILSGDHIYKMDYRKMIQQHIDTQADLTIGCKIIDPKEAFRFGMLEADTNNLISRFEEKPKHTTSELASMGIYVFNTDVLLSQLRNNQLPDLDFGKHIIPEMIKHHPVYSYRFNDYWKDVGTYDSYLHANLELIETVDKIPLDMYDPFWKIYTKSEELPAVKIGSKAIIRQALLSNGSIVAGTVERSVLSPGVIVHPFAKVTGSVLLNNVEVKPGAILENVIIDKHTVIGENAMVGFGGDMTPNIDQPELLTSGITVLGKRLLVPKNMVIGRNCRIFQSADLEHVPEHIIHSGSTIK
ncbi:MAG: sugar phosphate nucleotidyltransferase [Candidatus Izemoplasmatales bacterium]|nr:sugar phosphate nucleotidyltransferase [Candidatus Izemoplasmatales bacterium]MDD5293777.1 sugar phosphate nucleotidyltransferase [Candidatus Izemoplasmatales bacterium]